MKEIIYYHTHPKRCTKRCKYKNEVGACNGECLADDSKTINIPEDFAELRELCKELKKKTSTPMNIGRTHIAISTLSKDLFFQEDGSIEYGWDILFKNSASNKKDWGYMYLIIKSLIGEE